AFINQYADSKSSSFAKSSKIENMEKNKSEQKQFCSDLINFILSIQSTFFRITQSITPNY
ncbi:hypothetical protein, partial [Flavobacterium branchiicola]